MTLTDAAISVLFLKQQCWKTYSCPYFKMNPDVKIHQAQIMKDWPPQSLVLDPIESWNVLESILHCLSQKS